MRLIELAPAWICLILIIFNYHLLAQDSLDLELIWPFEDHSAVSSTFGEYRADHIHLGLDIKTNGKIGAPVLAVEDGYVSQVKIRSGGYGRALYLTLKDGRTAVYAHLAGYEKDLEQFIFKQQWESRSYPQNLEFPEDKFSFAKGDIIAYSGQSAAEAPHLHFEIRTHENTCLNPLTQGLSVEDHRAPVIRSLGIIPLSPNSEIDGDCRPIVYEFKKQKDRYSISEKPQIYGTIGIAICAQDYADEASNPLSAYRVTLKLDGEERFSAQYDSCEYEHYTQVNFEREPYFSHQGWGSFSRLFKAEINQLPFYRGDGVINSDSISGGWHQVVIEVSDYYLNQSEAEFEILALSSPEIPDPIRVDYFQEMGNPELNLFPNLPWYKIEFFPEWVRIEVKARFGNCFWLNNEKSELVFCSVGQNAVARLKFKPEAAGWNYLYSPEYGVMERCYLEMVTPAEGGMAVSPDLNFKAIFPPEGVEDTVYCQVQTIPVQDLLVVYEYGDVQGYQLGPEWIGLNQPISLNWSFNDTSSQIGIYSLNKDGKARYLGNRRREGEIIGGSFRLGTFMLIYDRLPPVAKYISQLPVCGYEVARMKLKISLKDDLSGIDQDRIEAGIDGKWVLAEYDPPRSAVYLHLQEELAPGIHRLDFKSADRVGNIIQEVWDISIK